MGDNSTVRGIMKGSVKSFRDARVFGYNKNFFWYKFSCRVEVKLCFCL